MNIPWLNKIRLHAFTAAAALALSGSVLLAQDTAPAPGSRTDGQIEMDVVHALDASAALKNDLITAATIQGEVTLSGIVASDADRQLAESIVNKVSGVTKVNNRLTIGNPADDPNNAAPPEDSAPIADNQPGSQQNPPSYSPSPDQAPQPSYPTQNQQDQQQAQNYPQPAAPVRPAAIPGSGTASRNRENPRSVRSAAGPRLCQSRRSRTLLSAGFASARLRPALRRPRRLFHRDRPHRRARRGRADSAHQCLAG